MKNLNFIAKDDLKVRKLLNIASSCSVSNKEVISNDDLKFILSLKSRHFILAKQQIFETDSIVDDMALFEYLFDNIKNIESLEEDDIYV